MNAYSIFLSQYCLEAAEAILDIIRARMFTVCRKYITVNYNLSYPSGKTHPEGKCKYSRSVLKHDAERILGFLLPRINNLRFYRSSDY